MQVDTYWSFHAGMENYKLITENRDKLELLAKTLLEKETMDGREVEALVRKESE